MAEDKKKEKKAAESVIGSVDIGAEAETAGTAETTGTTGTAGTAATTGTAATGAQSSQKSQSSQESQNPADPADPVDAASSPRAEKAEPTVDWKDLYARLRADFDNFKKRTARDREDTYRYAESDILKDILPTVDNLALALANADAGKVEKVGGGGDGEDQTSSFVKGVQLVYDTLLKSLKDHGAEPFDSVGEKLDTEKMEAIATLPSETVAEGLVSNEVKRGWMLKGKVLRAAQVVVSSGKA